MLEWFRGLFGEGRIRFEVVTLDGRKGSGTIPYRGDFSTIDEVEIKQEIIDQLWVNKGERIREIKIVGHY